MSAFDPFHQGATLCLPLFNRDLYTKPDWKNQVRQALNQSAKDTREEVKIFFNLIPSYYDERAKDRSFRRHEFKTKALMSVPNSQSCDTDAESSMGQYPLAEVNDWRSTVLMADALLYLHRGEVDHIVVGTRDRCYDRRGIQAWSERAVDRLRDLYPLLVECKTVIERLAAEHNQNEKETHGNIEIRALELLTRAKRAGSHEHAHSMIAKFSWVGVWYALCLSGVVPTRRNISMKIKELADKYEGYSELRLKDEITPKTLATVNLWFQFCPFIACLRWAAESKPVSDADMNILFRSLVPDMSPVVRVTRARFHRIAFEIATGMNALSAISQGINDCLTLLREKVDRIAVASWHTFGPVDIPPSSKIPVSEDTGCTVRCLENTPSHRDNIDQTDTGSSRDPLETAGGLQAFDANGISKETSVGDSASESGCADHDPASAHEDGEHFGSATFHSAVPRKSISSKGKRVHESGILPVRKKRKADMTAPKITSTKHISGHQLAVPVKSAMGSSNLSQMPRALEGSQPGERAWGPPADGNEGKLASSWYYETHGVQLLPHLGKGALPSIEHDLLLNIHTFMSDGSPVTISHRPTTPDRFQIFDHIFKSCKQGSLNLNEPLWLSNSADSQFLVMNLHDFESKNTAELLGVLQCQNIIVKGDSELTKNFFHAEGFTIETISQLGEIHTARKVEDQSVQKATDPSRSLRTATLAEVYEISQDPKNEAVVKVLDIPYKSGPFTFLAPPRYLDLAHDYAELSKWNTPQLAGHWQWGTVCTVRASSLPRVDASGCYTCFVFGGNRGILWFVFKPSNHAGAQNFTPNQPWLMNGQWESVYLMPGDLLIQKCNQIHAEICGAERDGDGEICPEGITGGSLVKTGCFLNLFAIKDTIHGFLQCHLDDQLSLSGMQEQAIVQSLQRLIFWIEAQMKNHGDNSFSSLALLDFRLDSWVNINSILCLLNLHDSLVVINGKLSGTDEVKADEFVQARANYWVTSAKAMSIRTMFERSLDLYINGRLQPKFAWTHITQVSLAHMLASIYVYQEDRGRHHTPRWKFLYPQTVAFLQNFKASPGLEATIEEMYKVKVSELRGRAYPNPDWTNWDKHGCGALAREKPNDE